MPDEPKSQVEVAALAAEDLASAVVSSVYPFVRGAGIASVSVFVQTFVKADDGAQLCVLGVASSMSQADVAEVVRRWLSTIQQ